MDKTHYYQKYKKKCEFSKFDKIKTQPKRFTFLAIYLIIKFNDTQPKLNIEWIINALS